MLGLINKHIANGFSDFEGLKIQGSVPITEEIINEIISEILSSLAKSYSSASATPTSSKLNLDMGKLLMRVKKAEIKAEQGKVTLIFEIS